MQLVKTSRDNLLRPLQIVSGIVERRHTLPILASLLITKQGERVSFLSTDIEIQTTTHVDCGAGAGDVAIVVATHKLVDILRAMPDDEVALTLNDKRMTVQSGKSHFALQTLAAGEFPTVAGAADSGARITLPQKTLKHLLAMAHFMMAQQGIHYYLNDMLLTMDGRQVMAIAADGHRLAYCGVGAGEQPAGAGGRQEVIISRKIVLGLQYLLEDVDDPVSAQLTSNQVEFIFGNIKPISKLVEGKFPGFQCAIPKGYRSSFAIDHAFLQQALQRTITLTTDKFKGVRCMLDTNVLKIGSTNAGQEEAQEELEIDYQDDTLDIGFNVTYLLDVLASLRAEKVQVSLGDSNSSALITLPDDDTFKHVVMPMRI